MGPKKIAIQYIQLTRGTYGFFVSRDPVSKMMDVPGAGSGFGPLLPDVWHRWAE
jgi:hypothetical protein